MSIYGTGQQQVHALQALAMLLIHNWQLLWESNEKVAASYLRQ